MAPRGLVVLGLFKVTPWSVFSAPLDFLGLRSFLPAQIKYSLVDTQAALETADGL